MTLEILQNDMAAALKRRDTLTKDVLSEVVCAVKNAAIAKKCKDNITEELVNEVLLKEKKVLQEQIDTCPIERKDLIVKYGLKMEVMEKYCPKLIDNPFYIRELVTNQLTIAGIEPIKSNRSIIMKTIMPTFKGKADMKVVNEVVSSMLS